MKHIQASLLILLLSVASCASAPIVDTKIASYEAVSIPTVKAVTIKPVTVNIDNSGNAVIDAQSYKNLQLDIADTTRWISQESAVVKMLSGIVNERSAPTEKSK